MRSDRSWELNANSSKTVEATDFKFDTYVPRDSPDMTPKNFPKRRRGHGPIPIPIPIGVGNLRRPKA